MILFGALSAGTKPYLLCRSDRHAFTSAFGKTLPMGCLKFCFSLEIGSSVWPFTISFQDIELKALPFSVWPIAMHTGQQFHTSDKFLSQPTLHGSLYFRPFCSQISQLRIWNDRKVTSGDYMAVWLI